MKTYFKYICIFLMYIITIITPIQVNANSISLNKSTTTLGVGYSEILEYNLGEGLDSSEIIWKSANESVAIVENGKVIALSEGQTIITASINGMSSTCKITVVSNFIPVISINLNKKNTTLLVGENETLAATINPTNATNYNITWTSSNPSVATVNSSGKITATGVGTTTITASSGTTEAKCEVTVTYSLSLNGISINKSNLTIKEKEKEQLNIIYNPSNATNKKVTWKSSNESIVTINQNGYLTAIAPGTATITAVSNDGGYVATCKVTVEEISKKVTDISLDKSEINIQIGQTEELKATIKPDYAENKNIIWTSSDQKIATVENGIITAVSPGTVEVKATSEDGNKEAICKVTVTSPPIEYLSFKETEITVYEGSETTLTYVVMPENAVLENAIWTSSNEKIATIKNGKLKAKKIGETIVTVSNKEETLNASIKINVISAPKEPLKITVEGYNLNFNKDIKSYTLTIGNENELIIKTNVDEQYVNIKGNQKLKNGSMITITIDDEEKVTYAINIKKKQNYTIYFIAIISVMLLLNLIRIMSKNKKKAKF